MEPKTLASPSAANLNETASANLSLKLDRVRIPRRFFPEGLAINDIYSNSSRTRIPQIPKELQLPFIFANHTSLFRANHSARKPTTQLEYDIDRALWYWSLSRQRSLSFSLNQVRFNVALIVVVLSRLDAQHLVKPSAVPFIQTYLDAWLENLHRPTEFIMREAFLQIWATGPFDLMCFRPNLANRMQKHRKRAFTKLDALHGTKRLIVPSGQDEFFYLHAGSGRWTCRTVRRCTGNGMDTFAH